MTQLEPIFTNDTKYVNLQKLVLKKINRTHLVIGSFETFQDANNDFEVKPIFNILVSFSKTFYYVFLSLLDS